MMMMMMKKVLDHVDVGVVAVGCCCIVARTVKMINLQWLLSASIMIMLPVNLHC